MTKIARIIEDVAVKGILLVVITLTGCITINTNDDLRDIPIFAELIKTSNVDTCLTLYHECQSWEITTQNVGQESCFLGRINKVFYEMDKFSGADVWTAYFDPSAAKYPSEAGVYDNTRGLVIISFDRDISGYEGECVAVFGKLLADDENSKDDRAMIDIDPNDDRIGFTIFDCNCP
jgi:hypothetical protein